MCSFQGMAQHARAVLTDPELGKIKFTDVAGYQLDEAYVQPGEIIKMKIPVLNNNHGQALPAGSCKIKIGLGSKLVLDPAYDLNSAALNSYFRWTAAENSGQVQVTGELIAPLPANVNDVDVSFKVKGAGLGHSTITANFLISNHNTVSIVSDEDGTNNASYLAYTVTDKPAPVSVTTINEVVKEGCEVKVSFGSDKEINLSRYELEASKDGVSFEKVATVTAAGNLSYTSSFALPVNLQVQQLSVRIKAVETTGRASFTAIKVVNGLCIALPIKLSLFPNPASLVSSVTISATQGVFEGKYKVKVMDMAGKTVSSRDYTLNGVQQFKLPLGNIAAGKYLVQVSTLENVQLGLLKFEKL
jgi:Secretion system C-terminal sorting domain